MIAKILNFVFKFSFLPFIKTIVPTTNAEGVNIILKLLKSNSNRENNPKINEEIARYFKDCFVSVILKLSPLSKSGLKSKGEILLVSSGLLLSNVKSSPAKTAGIKLKVTAQIIEKTSF